jgi:asparagine N-glycosylation enzyme membrane subunit Stt3
MAWWDYGHWITRIAHRVPICNPFQQGPSQAARFFTAQNEELASQIIDNLGSKYIVIDHATVTDKFHAVTTWAGSNEEKFYDVYHYQAQDGKLVPILFYHAEYYRSLAVRLYNFDASSVIPESSTVISYEEKINREGKHYKKITNSISFYSYEAAEAYVSRQEPSNHKIVGTNPFISPVSLDVLEQYRLVHNSNSSIIQPDVGAIPNVKIFEYIK